MANHIHAKLTPYMQIEWNVILWLYSDSFCSVLISQISLRRFVFGNLWSTHDMYTIFVDMWRQYVICNKIHSGGNDEISEYYLSIRSYCKVLRGKVDTSQGKKLHTKLFWWLLDRQRLYKFIPWFSYTNNALLYTRWFKYDRDWFVCKQAALRSSFATLREWSHNLHPPSCSV